MQLLHTTYLVSYSNLLMNQLYRKRYSCSNIVNTKHFFLYILLFSSNKRCISQYDYIIYHCAVSYNDEIILKISIKSPYDYLPNDTQLVTV